VDAVSHGVEREGSVRSVRIKGRVGYRRGRRRGRRDASPSRTGRGCSPARWFVFLTSTFSLISILLHNKVAVCSRHLTLSTWMLRRRPPLFSLACGYVHGVESLVMGGAMQRRCFTIVVTSRALFLRNIVRGIDSRSLCGPGEGRGAQVLLSLSSIHDEGAARQVFFRTATRST
jgi:hypothetical protein